MRKFTLLLCIATLIGCADTKNTETADTLNITFSTPAEMWEETLPLGNGSLGAMPDGGITKETLVLNEETMWSGCEWDASNPDALKFLPEIRKKLKSVESTDSSESEKENINNILEDVQ